MLTEQDLIISKSFIILIGSFLIFSALGIFHPKEKFKYERVRMAAYGEMPRIKRF